MKAIWLVLVILLAPAAGYAKDSAYQALRLVGGGNSSQLNHVIEVSGEKGDPQPSVWRVLLDDPSARGGVRELEVSKGRIISEHTPVRAYAGTSANAVMDFHRLNLDSDGAFTIASQEAAKRHVGFDSVDYVLRGDEQTNAPVWILKLLDADRVNVGTVYVAADNGTVLRTENMGVARNTVQDTYTPPNNAAPPSPDNPGDGGEPPPGPGIGHQIDKGIHRFGASLQQFFTGKRTWDQRFDNEP